MKKRKFKRKISKEDSHQLRGTPSSNGFRDSQFPYIGNYSMSLKNFIILWILFALIATALYFLGLESPMIYDSHAKLYSNLNIFDKGDLKGVLAIFPPRPATMLSFYCNYIVSGMKPFHFRLFSIAILALNSTVLSILFLSLAEAVPARRRNINDAKVVAVCVGLLFLVHPLNIYATLYIWQRGALLACLFSCSVLVVYLALRAGRITNKPLGYIVLLLMFLCALLSKENAVIIPLFLMVLEISLYRTKLKELLIRGAIYSFITVSACVVLSDFEHPHGKIDLGTGIITVIGDYYSESGKSLFEVVLTQCRNLWRYLGLIVCPTPSRLQIVSPLQVSKSLLSSSLNVIAVVATCSLMVTGIWLLRRKPLYGIGIVWFLVALIPESFLVPQYLFFCYRAILPMAGVLLIVGQAALDLANYLYDSRSFALSRAVLWGACGLVLFAFGCVTFYKSLRWSPLMVWRDAYENLPKYSDSVERLPYRHVLQNYAQALEKEGRLSQSIKILERVIDIGLADALTYYNLGVANLNGDQVGTAIQNFKRAIELEPGFALAHSRLGRALYQIGDTKNGLKSISKATKLQPDVGEFWCDLGTAQLGMDRLDRARSALNNSIARSPYNGEAYFQYGLLCEKIGDYVCAIKYFTEAIRLIPNHMDAISGMGGVLSHLGKYKEALEYYREAKNIRPMSADAHYNLANALWKSNRSNEAEAAYRRAISLDPSHEKSQYNLALLLQNTGNSSESERLYRKVIAMNPRHIGAHINLGNLLLGSGNIDEAKILYDNAIKIEPSNPDAHLSLGSLLLKLGKIRKARRHFEKALECRPDWAEAHVNLGLVDRDQKKFNEAEGHFKVALGANPNLLTARLALAKTLREKGEFERAIEQYQLALKLNGALSDVRCDMADALLQSGKYESARNQYQQILRQQPNHTRAHNNLGYIYMMNSQYKQAVNHFETAFRLQPLSKDIEINLAEAKKAAARNMTKGNE
jgi:tetratricopeptide (TPR) repeat protein